MSNITKPEHYQSTIEPIDFIVANNLNFIEGNIIKYVARYKKKNGLEDLLKGFEYYKKLIELVENENNLQKTQNAIINKDNKLIEKRIFKIYTYETTSCYSLIEDYWQLYLFKINEELEFYFFDQERLLNGKFIKHEEFNKNDFEGLVYNETKLKKITYENVKFTYRFEKQDAGVYIFETDNETFTLKPNEN